MPAKPKTLEAQIDENLRRVFEEDAEAELPDRLIELLSRLEDIDAPAVAKLERDADIDSGGTGEQTS